MRTPEQIRNLRHVFCQIYGPIAFFWPNETIDHLAEKFQSEINENSKWTWEIRVLTEEINLEDPWNNIEPEPTQPCCTMNAIKEKCKNLLKKYPAIISILIIAKENRKLVFQFDS